MDALASLFSSLSTSDALDLDHTTIQRIGETTAYVAIPCADHETGQRFADEMRSRSEPPLVFTEAYYCPLTLQVLLLVTWVRN